MAFKERLKKKKGEVPRDALDGEDKVRLEIAKVTFFLILLSLKRIGK